MARYGVATWKPLPSSCHGGPMKPTQVILHTAVSNGSSLFQVFVNEHLSSHFYVQNGGGVEQYVDTLAEAWAQFAGNARAISVETWDGYPTGWHGDDGAPPWNPAQVEAIAGILAWAHRTHGIPLVRCSSSTAPGIGYHRQFQVWNTNGHSCPTTPRIAQIPAIIARAIELVNGVEVVTSDDISKIVSAVWGADIVPMTNPATNKPYDAKNPNSQTVNALAWVTNHVHELRDKSDAQDRVLAEILALVKAK